MRKYLITFVTEDGCIYYEELEANSAKEAKAVLLERSVDWYKQIKNICEVRAL